MRAREPGRIPESQHSDPEPGHSGPEPGHSDPEPGPGPDPEPARRREPSDPMGLRPNLPRHLPHHHNPRRPRQPREPREPSAMIPPALRPNEARGKSPD